MFQRLLLTRLQPKFAKLVRAYLKKNRMTQQDLSDLVDISRPHLNSLINLHPTRPLSAAYLIKFIQRRIITVAQINDNKPESGKEKDFWRAAEVLEDYDLVKKIAQVQDQHGVDVKKLLDTLYPDTGTTQKD